MNLSPEIPDWVPAQLRDRRLWWSLMGCGLAMWRPDALRRVIGLMQSYHERRSTALLQELEDTLGVFGLGPAHIQRIIQAIPLATDHLG